ncbi:hypothetical protein P7C70_g1706, partial [Phenoliferia sp. Uapishka_3]
MSSPPPAAIPLTDPDFSSSELNAALLEVGWGLTAWEILPPSFCKAGESRAKLELLEEGDTAVIAVSQKGWTVCLRSVVDYGPDSAAQDPQVFETLDHLLAYLSPLFEKRRIKLLSDSLENISVRRSWGEEDGFEEAKE